MHGDPELEQKIATIFGITVEDMHIFDGFFEAVKRGRQERQRFGELIMARADEVAKSFGEDWEYAW